MAGYDNSKMNRQHWATSVEGPMTCRVNCPYKPYFVDVCCKDGHQPVGTACVVDLTYSVAYAESMRSDHPLLVKYRPDEFEAVIEEAVRIALQRERLCCRSNRAWELPPKEMYAELDLTYRYWVAMHRRFLKLCERIEHLTDDVGAELEDRRWRRKALSCIGAADVPEPYRHWAKQVIADYRKAQATS